MVIDDLVSIRNDDGSIKYAFPEPSTYNVTASTLVDSGRNTNGVVVGSVIREDVHKIEMSWRYLTTEQLADMLRQFSGNYGGNFFNHIKFFDQTLGDYQTLDMYVGDRNSAAWRRDPETGEILGWTGFKISLIEM